MLMTCIIMAEITVVILVICKRREINAAVKQWFNQNKFFIFVLVGLILLFASVDMLIFFPNEFSSISGVISKLAEWAIGLLS